MVNRVCLRSLVFRRQVARKLASLQLYQPDDFSVKMASKAKNIVVRVLNTFFRKEKVKFYTVLILFRLVLISEFVKMKNRRKIQVSEEMFFKDKSEKLWLWLILTISTK